MIVDLILLSRHLYFCVPVDFYNHQELFSSFRLVGVIPKTSCNSQKQVVKKLWFAKNYFLNDF